MNTYTPTQADIEFNAFRLLFPFHTGEFKSCYLDENEMRYQFENEASACHACEHAKDMIAINRLHLLAEVEIWKRGDRVFNSCVVITYKPKPNA
jgi:hypothetical protein